jgi:hypothetical protein
MTIPQKEIHSGTDVVTLEVMMAYVAIALNDTELKNVKFDAVYDPTMQSTILSLTAFVLGDKIETVSVSHPTTWWDAFKVRWFPKWALERWPADVSRYELTADVFYPDIKLPDHKHFKHLMKRNVE